MINRYLYYILTSILCVSMPLGAQTIKSDLISIDFGTNFTNETDSQKITLKNTTTSDIKLTDINLYPSGKFYTKDTAFTILQNSDQDVWIYSNLRHNLLYNGVIHFAFEGKYGHLLVDCKVQGRYKDTMYRTTENLSDEALKTALKKRFAPHTVLGYTTARDYMYGNIDIDANDSHTCVYTGRRAKFDTRAGAVNENFNCEHTFPQSKFLSKDPMQSDLFHLYPVDERANSSRSDNPFDTIPKSVTPTYWGGVNGSKYYNGKFEPRDLHKGNAGRSLLYMVLMYQDFTTFVSPQEVLLRQWHFKYLPTAKDIKRCDLVQKYQKNRNPLIDHPELLDAERMYIVCKTTARPLKAQPIVPVTSVNLGIVTSDTSYYDIPVINSGSTTMTVANISTKKSALSATISSSTIDKTNGKALRLMYLKQSAGTYTDSVSFTIDGNSYMIPFEATQLTSINKSLEKDNSLTIYPNPNNGWFTVQSTINQRIEMYNTVGQLVHSQTLTQGSELINVSHLPKGMYFVHGSQGGNLKVIVGR